MDDVEFRVCTWGDAEIRVYVLNDAEIIFKKQKLVFYHRIFKNNHDVSNLEL